MDMEFPLAEALLESTIENYNADTHDLPFVKYNANQWAKKHQDIIEEKPEHLPMDAPIAEPCRP